MKRRRQTRPDPRVLTAKTGDDIFGAEEEGITSDLGVQPATTAAPPVPGHTAVDLLYETGLQHALAKVVGELDPVEILGTATYVVLNVWGKSTGLVLQFWKFAAILAGYHAVARPSLKLVFQYLEARSRVSQQ